MAKVYVYNHKDFKGAKKKLEAIIGNLKSTGTK